MNSLSAVAWPPNVAHNTQREGIRLGLILGTATWLWVALVDAVAQQPFHTFATLGGVAVFTAVHYLLNIIYGIVLLSAVHGAEHTPSLTLALVFGTMLFETAMAMLTAILAQFWLGETAWPGVFGGSLIATAIALFFLSRTHPLLANLHRAEEES